MLQKNLLCAAQFCADIKNKEKDVRFRIETNVRRDTVRVYVIYKNKIVGIVSWNEDNKQSSRIVGRI